jgi:hypothetical protein
MAVQTLHYESLLAHCSHYAGALALLKQYRPYLETLPSMRRPQDSIVTIPLPNVRVRRPEGLTPGLSAGSRQVMPLPCDVVLLMCDPEWKIKTGVEIFLFIHRPDEEFSEILMRWRQTQALLGEGYEWLMPRKYEHLLNQGADQPYPLFALFPQTPERIGRGLRGAGLPVIVHSPLPDPAQADVSPPPMGDTLPPEAELDAVLEAAVDWQIALEPPDDRSDDRLEESP